MPLAARLAPAEERGRWMGTVTSGLLVGIMLARSLSSFAAAAWGWQSIYVISAGLMLVLSVALRFLLPPAEPLYRASYGSLIRSTVELARSEPILRRRSLAQALMFGTFTTFWTAIAYELASRHGLDQTEIAVFALVGAAGALSAPLIGRLGDSGHGAVGRFVGFALAIAAMTLAALGASSVALLVTAAVVLDVGAQFNYVLSMRDIYELAPDARARINSVFMTTMFLGGAVASALTGVISDRWGWSGVCLFGIVCGPTCVTQTQEASGVSTGLRPDARPAACRGSLLPLPSAPPTSITGPENRSITHRSLARVVNLPADRS